MRLVLPSDRDTLAALTERCAAAPIRVVEARTAGSAGGDAVNKIDAPALSTNPLGVAAVEFLDLALNQKKVDEAIDRYLAAPYTQHNPIVSRSVV